MNIEIKNGLMYVYADDGEFVGTAMSYDEAWANIKDYEQEKSEK